MTADEQLNVERYFTTVLHKFEIHSYRNAATILAESFREQHLQIIHALEKFEITTDMIRMSGGSKGPIAKYVDGLFIAPDWEETRITADLHVKLQPSSKESVERHFIRKRYIDGHRIDFVCGKVALELEWNSKDQTFDRDLYAFSAFHTAGVIDVGILLTRGSSLNTKFMRDLGKVLKESGEEGSEDVYKKFGASTTSMDKLLPRLEAGRNGGCPVLALGIKPKCVIDSNLRQGRISY